MSSNICEKKIEGKREGEGVHVWERTGTLFQSNVNVTQAAVYCRLTKHSEPRWLMGDQDDQMTTTIVDPIWCLSLSHSQWLLLTLSPFLSISPSATYYTRQLFCLSRQDSDGWSSDNRTPGASRVTKLPRPLCFSFTPFKNTQGFAVRARVDSRHTLIITLWRKPH